MAFEPVHAHGDRPYEWVSELTARRAALTPDAPAVTDLHADRTWSYAELDARVNRTTRLLASLEVGVDDRIAVIARNRIEYLDLCFAAAKRGAIIAPLSHRLAAGTTDKLLQLVEPTLVIAEDQFAELIPDTVEAHRLRLVDDAEAEPSWAIYHEQRPPDDSHVEPTPRSLADPIMLLHTGGTTGTPKETVITHGGMLWNSINTITGWGLRPDDVTPMVFPFFHTGGWNVLTVPFIHHGGHLIIDRAVDPEAILACVDQYNATVLVAVPTVFRAMADAPAFDETDLSSLRLVKSGGGPCREDVIDAWADRDVRLTQGYGLTECGPNNFGMPPNADRPDSVGVPMPHVDARVVDEEGTEVSAGEVGELELASPHAADRYWSNETETADTFGDGWVSTGDLARIDEAGFVTIEGRKKHMFVSGGENVYPGEVEAAIAEHPAIEEVVVLGIEDDKWGEIGLAVVESSTDLSLDDVRTFLDGRLARFKHPRHLEQVETMPTSGPDKIDRMALRERFAEENR